MNRRDGLRRSVKVTNAGPRNRGYGRMVNGRYRYTRDFRGTYVRVDRSDDKRRWFNSGPKLCICGECPRPDEPC